MRMFEICFKIINGVQGRGGTMKQDWAMLTTVGAG